MRGVGLAFGVLVAIAALVFGGCARKDTGESSTSEPTAVKQETAPVAPDVLEPAPPGVASKASDSVAEPGPLVWRVYPADELANITNPHDYQGSKACQRCHSDEGGGLLADTNALCGGCHTLGHNSHPVDIVQQAPVPDDVRLGPNNQVLCTSCHETHDMALQKAGLRRNFSSYCQKCHAEY